MRPTYTFAGMLLILLAIVSGCDGNGDPLTRAPTSREWLEAADAMTMQLAEDIPNRLAEREFRNYRGILLLGSVVNKTSCLPTTDMELVQNRIRNKLLQSELVRQKIIFLESRKRIEKLSADELRHEVEDLIQQGNNASVGEEYDPQYVFFLNWDGFSSGVGPERLYYFALSATRASNRQIVFAKDHEIIRSAARRH